MAAAAAARAALMKASKEGGGAKKDFSLTQDDVFISSIVESGGDKEEPFPHCVPSDGELFDLLRIQLAVYKKHLKKTIHDNNILDMETLDDEFEDILYGPFVEDKKFEVTKRHVTREVIAIEDKEDKEGPDGEGNAVSEICRTIIEHPLFGQVMISVILLAGVLVGATSAFDCGNDANGNPYQSCRIYSAAAGGRHGDNSGFAVRPGCDGFPKQGNLTMSQCAARSCCWRPSNVTGGSGICFAKDLMPECTDNPTVMSVIGALDTGILILFTIEMFIKIFAERSKPWNYWIGPFAGDAGWNTFDSIIVILCYMDIIAGGGFPVAVLRLARLTRVLKLLDKIEQLKIIMNGLMSGMSSVVYILIMLILVYYVFAIICMMLFRLNDPAHFGELHISMVTLFRMSTMEDWTDVMYINMYGCQKYGYGSGSFCHGFKGPITNERYYGPLAETDVTHNYCQSKNTCPDIPTKFLLDPEAWPDKGWSWGMSAGLFCFFIVIAGLVVMSLFIGVITTSMQIASDEAKTARKEAKQMNSRAEFTAEVEALMANPDDRNDPIRTVEQLEIPAPKELEGYAALATKVGSMARTPVFQNLITACIVAAGALIGIQTYSNDMDDEAYWSTRQGLWWTYFILDKFILVAFIVEIVLKVIGCGFKPWEYFYGVDVEAGETKPGVLAWNVFDFAVVGACLMPEEWTGEWVPALRLLRLLRVLKLFNKLTQLQIILMGLAKGMASVVWIAVLMIILYYLFACIAMSFFRHNDPVHFANLGTTFVTLFRCSTLEDWTDVMYLAMYGCKQYNPGDAQWIQYCENSESSGMVGAMFFITFILLSSLVMLNLIVGVVCSSMQEATDNHEAMTSKEANIKKIAELTGVEWEILKYWEKGFFCIDDSEGFQEGNIVKDDLPQLLCKLNEEDLLTSRGREHLYVKASHSMPTGQISLLDFLETMAKDLANYRKKAAVGGVDGEESTAEDEAQDDTLTVNPLANGGTPSESGDDTE